MIPHAKITRYCALCSWSHTSRTQEENDAMLRVHTLEEHCAPAGMTTTVDPFVIRPILIQPQTLQFIGARFCCDQCDWSIDTSAEGSAGALGRHMWDAHDGFDARLTDAGRAVLRSLNISAE